MKQEMSPRRNLDAGLRIPRLLCAGAWAMAVLLCAASLAVAEETVKSTAYSGDFLSRTTHSGDLGGARNRLDDHGITIKPRLSMFYQGLSSGKGEGESGDEWEFGGKADLQLDADFGKLGLIKGLSLTVHGRHVRPLGLRPE